MANPTVVIETSLGTVTAEIYEDKAPLTAANFLELAESGYYNGIIFHRVIPRFMVQTGCPLGTGTGGRTDKGLPRKVLKDEFHPALKHDKPGVLSMANRGPDTGDTQIFLTTVPTPWLDGKHAIFGAVTSGMEVVTAIESLPRNERDRPNAPPKIVSVTVRRS